MSNERSVSQSHSTIYFFISLSMNRSLKKNKRNKVELAQLAYKSRYADIIRCVTYFLSILIMIIEYSALLSQQY